MNVRSIFMLIVLVQLVIAACAPVPLATPVLVSAVPSATATPAGIPPAAAVAPVVSVLVPQVPRTARFRILVVGCPDGRCLEEIAGSRTQVRYFRSIAGVVPSNMNEIVLAEEARIGGKFDLIVVGTHDGFCATGRCGGQELLNRFIDNPDLKVPAELVQTKAWVKSNIVTQKVLSQALLDGDTVVRLTGAQRNVLVTVFDTSSQMYNPVRVFTSGQGWSLAVTEVEWTAAETAGWKQIPTILTKGVSMPEVAQAFIADNQVQAPTLAEIARARNFQVGQTFPEIIVTNSLRPVSERLGLGMNQGERFVVTFGRGMNTADVNAQVAYALAHAQPETNVRFLFERTQLQQVDWLAEIDAANTNPAFLKWMKNPAMRGTATLEVWDEMTQAMKTTLRPAGGVPVESFLMRGGGGGAMVLLPGVFFEAAKLASRDDVKGAQSSFSPNAEANALPKEFGLELSPIYRFHTGPDFMTMWSQLINRVPGGESKACIKRALTDVAGSLLLIQSDIPTMMSICPSVWPPTQELVGAAIVYAVPSSSQEPITVAYRDGKWEQVSGTTLEYQLRITNKSGIPFQAIFELRWENGKEVHNFVRLVCGPPAFADKLAVCPSGK